MLDARPVANAVAFERNGPAAPSPEVRAAGEKETMRRALDNPEVQRAQELFPGSTVRSVRDLKE